MTILPAAGLLAGRALAEAPGEVDAFGEGLLTVPLCFALACFLWIAWLAGGWSAKQKTLATARGGLGLAAFAGGALCAEAVAVVLVLWARGLPWLAAAGAIGSAWAAWRAGARARGSARVVAWVGAVCLVAMSCLSWAVAALSSGSVFWMSALFAVLLSLAACAVVALLRAIPIGRRPSNG